MFCDLYVALACQRFYFHEDIGNAVPDIFIVNTFNLPRLSWNRPTDFANPLFRLNFCPRLPRLACLFSVPFVVDRAQQ
jgi:hypothetical protein